MKVVHFIGSIDRDSGGIAANMQLLAAELKKLTKLLVVTSMCKNPIDLKGVKIQFFDLSFRRWFRLKKEFRDFLKHEKPDVVHINGIWDPQNFLFQQAAKSLNIKVVISPHGMLEPYILKRHSYKKKLALILYQKKAITTADFLLTTATSELENMRRLGFKKPAGIIPNGLDISEVKEKNPIEAENPFLNILFLSRIHPKKGIELLIESVSRLKDQNFNVIIAGEGDQKYIEFLVNLSAKKELEHKIRFLGGVYGQDKWDLYEQANLFVLPTYSENFGIVIIEALAAGVPVITTKGTPWQELETFNCGWWIDLNVVNLCNALNHAINTSREELKSMGKRGRKLVEDKYDNKVLAKEMVELYNSVINS